MGKKLTPEHLAKLQAGRDRAKALKRLKALDEQTAPEPQKEPQVKAEPQVHKEEIAPEQSRDDLQRQLDEMKAFLYDLKAQGGVQGVAQDRNGSLVGTFEKYTVDPINYPSPVERLMKEPQLIPLAFDYNYEVDYQVHVSQYETKDGRNVKEPRFMVELRRVVLDDAGARTDQRYIVRKLTFHEDPQAAIMVARENGIDVDSFNEKDFLNEMRYIRLRDWLLEIFYPAPAQAMKGRQEVVVNNQIVELITVNSENSSSIPFGELNKKLRTR